MRELSMLETDLVGGEGAVSSFLSGAGAGGLAGGLAGGPVGAAAGTLIGGAIALGLYYL